MKSVFPTGHLVCNIMFQKQTPVSKEQSGTLIPSPSSLPPSLFLSAIDGNNDNHGAVKSLRPMTAMLIGFPLVDPANC